MSESTTAAVWDAKKRKRLHTAKNCDDNQTDFGGPDDVVFLPRGAAWRSRAASCCCSAAARRRRPSSSSRPRPTSARSGWASRTRLRPPPLLDARRRHGQVAGPRKQRRARARALIGAGRACEPQSDSSASPPSRSHAHTSRDRVGDRPAAQPGGLGTRRADPPRARHLVLGRPQRQLRPRLGGRPRAAARRTPTRAARRSRSPRPPRRAARPSWSARSARSR